MRQGLWRVWFLLSFSCAMLLMICGRAEAAMGTDRQEEETVTLDASLEESLRDVDAFLRENLPQMGKALSFSDLMKTLAAGEGRRAGRMLLDALRDGLFVEIQSGWSMMTQVFAIGICGAVFTGFSEIFSESGISETGFFMTCLMAFTVLSASFFQSVRVAGAVLGQQMEFMRMILPACLLSVAWAGASMTAAAWYGTAFFLIGACEWLYVRVLLPAAQVFAVLAMAGNMAKEEMFSRLTGFLKAAVRWGMWSLFGLTAGFQLIQGMVLPSADAVKSAGIRKLLAAIPGIGQSVETVTGLVLGSGVLIKNCVGAAASVVLAMLSLIPLVKLAVLLILYRLTAAFLEPTAD
ncbi:MAG: stage III sporulation protein AE, partial [Clostridiales bacterium]|nr:stage III sporulation protein AE [Clostridiales bacterium]